LFKTGIDLSAKEGLRGRGRAADSKDESIHRGRTTPDHRPKRGFYYSGNKTCSMRPDHSSGGALRPKTRPAPNLGSSRICLFAGVITTR
jgi:hypothetical protein